MSATISFSPLVGLRLCGAALTPWDDLAPGTGSLGRPVWGPGELLRDLELRLGLAPDDAPSAVREQVFATRLRALADRHRFWAASYATDAPGTAATLLAWRDALVDAGWTGAPVPDGGPRLEALAEIEALSDPALPLGAVDRLVRVAAALPSAPGRLYDALTLAERPALWSHLWQRVFALLAAAGTPVTVLEPRLPPPARRDTDLDRLQALILATDAPSLAPAPVRGDGTLLVLRAPTSWELGETVAALLRAEGPAFGSVVVIRAGEGAALDAGLAAQGLASLGLAATSPWRPALQVLPLAIELAFEPRDPHRVLELLTLPVGPLSGWVGRELARALTQAPGIGGPAWRAAKDHIREHLAGRPEDERARAERRLARVAEWLESPGTPRDQRAPRARLLEVATRVESWLRARAALPSDDPAQDAVLHAAHAQARAFTRVLADDGRAALTLVEARALADRVTASGLRAALADEQAGRLDHVDEPGALLVPRDTVLFWHAVAGTERRAVPEPWRAPERAALARAGVALPDVDARLADENAAWRRAVLAARTRLVLAIPDRAAGAACAPHPLWEEIVARLGADDAAVARLTVTAHDLRSTKRLPLAPAPGAPLPEPRVEWRVPAGAVPPAPEHSASSLDTLLRCPLRWTLQRRAKLYGGAIAKLPADHKLAGTLGHRLVQLLQEDGHLAAEADALERAAAARFDTLLREEGATWLLPGRAFHREQRRDLLVRAVRRLASALAESELTVEAMEKPVEADWGPRKLTGRIDLLARDRRGHRAVIDLKWGDGTYEKLLAAGLALQLAVYARAVAEGRPVPAGYFSLSRARFLTTEPSLLAGVEPADGPSTTETLDRAGRTLALVEGALASGRVPAAGVSTSPGLLPHLGVADPDLPRHLDYRQHEDGACKYCEHDPICGKAWEALR